MLSYLVVSCCWSSCCSVVVVVCAVAVAAAVVVALVCDVVVAVVFKCLCSDTVRARECAVFCSLLIAMFFDHVMADGLMLVDVHCNT